MRGGTAARFAIEAAFLVGVAVVLGFLNQRWPVILPAMAAALAVTYLSEWGASRIRHTGKRRATGSLAAAGIDGNEAVLAGAPRAVETVTRGPAAEAPTPSREPAAEAAARPERKEPEGKEPEQEAVEPTLVEESGVPPEQPPEVAPQPAPEPAKQPAVEVDAVDEPQPEPEPEPQPPVLVAVPSPPPGPPIPAEPVAEPAAESGEVGEVVALPSRGPREWNLWDLERLTRQHSGADVYRDEERAYLLVYLREFASSDGVLPVDFDGLVRESFGDLVGAGG